MCFDSRIQLKQLRESLWARHKFCCQCSDNRQFQSWMGGNTKPATTWGSRGCVRRSSEARRQAQEAQEKCLLQEAGDPERQRARRTLCPREGEDPRRWVHWTTRISRQPDEQRGGSDPHVARYGTIEFHCGRSAQSGLVSQPSMGASSAGSWWIVRQAGPVVKRRGRRFSNAPVLFNGSPNCRDFSAFF